MSVTHKLNTLTGKTVCGRDIATGKAVVMATTSHAEVTCKRCLGTGAKRGSKKAEAPAKKVRKVRAKAVEGEVKVRKPRKVVNPEATPVEGEEAPKKVRKVRAKAEGETFKTAPRGRKASDWGKDYIREKYDIEEDPITGKLFYRHQGMKIEFRYV